MNKQDINTPLLPMAMKIAAQTVGMDLVSVVPMSSPGVSRDFKREKAIARNNKLSKITGKEQIEVDDETTVSSGSLFYFDFKYK